MDERNAAKERGGGKPCGVSDDAAADRDDRAPTIRVGPNQRLVDLRDRLQILEALAIGQQDRVATAESRAQPLAVKTPDNGIRDDETPRSDAMASEQATQVVAEAFANQDGGGARPGGDVDADGVDHSALDSGVWAFGPTLPRRPGL